MAKESPLQPALSTLEEIFGQLQSAKVIPFDLLCAACPTVSREEVAATVVALQNIGAVVDKTTAVGEASHRLIKLSSAL